ncbi:hypothetical protein V2G26_007316 [Clonostachys chloroleuca]
MAYKQWIALKIRNRLRKGDIRVKEARLESENSTRAAKTTRSAQTSAPWGAHPNVFDPLDWDPHTSDYSIHHDPVQQDSTIGNMEFVIAKLA